MVSPLRAQCGGGLDAHHRAGSALVTDGPFTESVEQVVGFHLLESGDERTSRGGPRFAEGGDHVELRRLAT